MKKEELRKALPGGAHIGSYVEYMTSGVTPAEIVSMNLCLRQAHSGQVDGLSSSKEKD